MEQPCPQVGAWIVWVVALVVEHKADLQKKAFVRQCVKDKVTKKGFLRFI